MKGATGDSASGPGWRLWRRDAAALSGLLLGNVWLSFGCLMDGGVRWRACTWCLLAYLAAVAVLLGAARGRPLGRLEWAFVLGGWMPLLAAGIPTLLLWWRAAGYIG